MTLRQLIAVADSAYPDNEQGENLIRAYWRTPDWEHGDSLARFIALELKETYDPHAPNVDQIEEAIRVIVRGRRHLQTVVDAFERLLG